MRVSYGVVGHWKRRDKAIEIAESLNAALAMDEGDAGSLPNHDLAWRLAYDPAADWVVILEDDVILIDNFEEHVQDALNNVPREGAVSFYTGTAKPRPNIVRKAVAQGLERGCSWLRSNDLYWGPAVALPAHRVIPMLNFVQRVDRPYDSRIGYYLRANGLPCFYSLPSLVDHIDGPSLIKGCEEPRKAHVFEEPTNWNKRYLYMK